MRIACLTAGLAMLSSALHAYAIDVGSDEPIEISAHRLVEEASGRFSFPDMDVGLEFDTAKIGDHTADLIRPDPDRQVIRFEFTSDVDTISGPHVFVDDGDKICEETLQIDDSDITIGGLTGGTASIGSDNVIACELYGSTDMETTSVQLRDVSLTLASAAEATISVNVNLWSIPGCTDYGDGSTASCATSTRLNRVMEAAVEEPNHVVSGDIVRISRSVGTVNVPYMLGASAEGSAGDVQTFIRATNSDNEDVEWQISAIDDDGNVFSTSLMIPAKQTIQFNSTDLQDGNPDKGIPTGVGNGSGEWRLEVPIPPRRQVSLVNLIRTKVAGPSGAGDLGFLDIIYPRTNSDGQIRVDVFQIEKAGNRSRIRISNLAQFPNTVNIVATSDEGDEITSSFDLDALATKENPPELVDVLEEGQRYQLVITARQLIGAVNLLETKAGGLSVLQ